MSAPALDWADGDYGLTAAALAPVADVLLDALAVAPGERLLDVGCGTGNLALAAAARDARVTGVDPAAGLVARARERPGADAVDWAVMEGEGLPVAENAFDVVASCFAVIFAPDAARAAAGLRWAAAPGGRIGLTAWLPEGGIAEAGRILMGALAPDRRPARWFDPEVAADLLGGPVEVARHTLVFTHASAESWLSEQEQHHPVWRMAVRALPAATWAAARAETLTALESHNSEPAGFRVESPYVVVIARH